MRVAFLTLFWLFPTIAYGQLDYPTRWGPATKLDVREAVLQGEWPTAYIVAALNAPARVRAVADYRCDGSQATGGDQVELLAARDAAQANGGTVRVEGTLYVSSPGTTEYSGSADFTNSTAKLDNFSWDTGHAWSEVSQGDIVRLWSGDDGSGNTLEDNHEEYVGTVTAVDDPDGTPDNGDETITLSARMPTSSDYTSVEFRRLVFAVEWVRNVPLVGSSIKTSTIKLADGQNCGVLQVGNETTVNPSYHVRDLTIDGNRANQGDEDNTYIDRRCNGIVASNYCQDVWLTRVNVLNCKGDAVWLLRPWGTRVYSGWWEHCSGGGCYLGDNGGAWIGGLKINDVNGPAMVSRNSDSNHLLPRILGTNADIASAATDANGNSGLSDLYTRNEYSLKLLGSDDCAVTGAEIRGYDADAAGAVYISGCDTVSITGNVFKCNRVSGKEAVTFGTSQVSVYNAISGNVFDTHLDAGIAGLTDWLYNLNTIRHNSNQRAEDVTDYEVVQNVSGGAVNRRSVVVRSAMGFTTSTTQGDKQVIGILDGPDSSIADDAYGPVIIRGHVKWATCDNTAVGTDAEIDYSANDPLTVSANVAGALQPAASGDTVIAIFQGGAFSGDGDPATVAKDVKVVEPYVMP